MRENSIWNKKVSLLQNMYKFCSLYTFLAVTVNVWLVFEQELVYYICNSQTFDMLTIFMKVG